MGIRTAAVVVAALASCGVVVACSASTDPDPTSDAFVGPLSNDLIVEAPDTTCGDGEIGVGDTLRVEGFDYRPGAEVDLRYTVDPGQRLGTWDSVTARDDGTFSASLEMSRSIVQPGDTLTIKAEGSGESGLMQLSAEVDVGSC